MKDVAIVTPWYPSRKLPFRGAFVQAMVDATAPGCDRVTVYHCHAWVAPLTEHDDHVVGRANRELLAHAVPSTPTVGGANLRYVPVPVPRGRWHAEIAHRHAATLGAALGGGRIEAPIVHAHVGLPGGWAALRNARARPLRRAHPAGPGVRLQPGGGVEGRHGGVRAPLLGGPAARAVRLCR